MTFYHIGQEVPREEDDRLLRGRGRYVEDVREPGEARLVVVRSPHAHARIAAVDVRAAAQMEGVIAVLTGADAVARDLQSEAPAIPRRRRDGRPAYVSPRPVLAAERVRHVGEPVAAVVAETLEQARDAAELIQVEYEPLPAVTDAIAAADPASPLVWDDNPGNEAFFHEIGDKAAVDAAFARADHIVRHRLVMNRITANAMEPRGCIAAYDASEDRYTLRCTVQSVHGPKALLARIFRVPETKVRVVCDNMGGGFGMKGGVYGEYVLALWASEVAGRPVKWVAERSEGILSDDQARGTIIDAELALTGEGRFLAIRTLHWAAMGAYFSSDRVTIPLVMALPCLVNTYTIGALHAQVKAMHTNMMTIAPYRGGSRPEPLYVIEAIIDRAARELGFDPVELRRINTVAAASMPYTTPMKVTYDCGDFPRNLDDCVVKSDYAGFAARRAVSRDRGRLRGIGVATAVAPSGGQGFEFAEVRFEAGGTVTIISGSMDHGQGHGTAFKQILSERLGIEAERIRYRFGDSDVVTMGVGTFGSRSAMLGGSAVQIAADKLIERGRHIAAHNLEAAVEDVGFAGGRFTISGTDRGLALAEVVRLAFDATKLPSGMEPGFAERTSYAPPNASTFPAGAHVCEVEIDPETGKVALLRYTAVDDVGVVLNPLICEGQIHGGIVQGLGQALVENLVYDAEGQLVTASFMDYCMPRADDFCRFDLQSNPVPTAKNPLGVKGVGEAGTLCAIPAVMAAINDALHQIGAPAVEMPATPEVVWRAIQAATG